LKESLGGDRGGCFAGKRRGKEGVRGVGGWGRLGLLRWGAAALGKSQRDPDGEG